MNLDPKELRAQAKHLLELARTIEAAQNPEKFVQKKVNQKVAGLKRKMRYDLAKSFAGKK